MRSAQRPKVARRRAIVLWSGLLCAGVAAFGAELTPRAIAFQEWARGFFSQWPEERIVGLANGFAEALAITTPRPLTREEQDLLWEYAVYFARSTIIRDEGTPAEVDIFAERSLLAVRDYLERPVLSAEESATVHRQLNDALETIHRAVETIAPAVRSERIRQQLWDMYRESEDLIRIAAANPLTPEFKRPLTEEEERLFQEAVWEDVTDTLDELTQGQLNQELEESAGEYTGILLSGLFQPVHFAPPSSERLDELLTVGGMERIELNRRRIEQRRRAEQEEIERSTAERAKQQAQSAPRWSDVLAAVHRDSSGDRASPTPSTDSPIEVAGVSRVADAESPKDEVAGEPGNGRVRWAVYMTFAAVLAIVTLTGVVLLRALRGVTPARTQQ